MWQPGSCHILLYHILFLSTSLLSEQLSQLTKEKNAEVSHPEVTPGGLIASMSAITREHWTSIAVLGQVCLFVQLDVKYKSSLERTLQPERSSVTLWRGGDRKRYLPWDKEQLISPSGEERSPDLMNQQLCLRGREMRPCLIKKSTYTVL